MRKRAQRGCVTWGHTARRQSQAWNQAVRFQGLCFFAAADLVDLCGQMWQGDGLLMRSHSASRRFYFVDPDTDCELWVRAAAPSDRIRFQFRFFLVYTLTSESPASPAPNASSPASADACAPGSYLQFYEGPPGAPRPLGAPLCGLTIPVPVMSSGEFLGLRLVTRGRQPRVDFVGEVTSFRLGRLGLLARTRASKLGATNKTLGAQEDEGQGAGSSKRGSGDWCQDWQGHTEGHSRPSESTP